LRLLVPVPLLREDPPSPLISPVVLRMPCPATAGGIGAAVTPDSALRIVLAQVRAGRSPPNISP
jgi:hypothetical protein